MITADNASGLTRRSQKSHKAFSTSTGRHAVPYCVPAWRDRNGSGAVLRLGPWGQPGHVRGPLVEVELVALDVLHHDARLVVVIGRQ